MGLTHSALARLVGARRPSVTSALGDLGRDRLLERTEDGWLLRGDPAHLVDPVTERLLSPGVSCIAPPWRKGASAGPRTARPTSPSACWATGPSTCVSLGGDRVAHRGLARGARAAALVGAAGLDRARDPHGPPRAGAAATASTTGPLTLDEEVADLDAVLDAAGSDRVVLRPTPPAARWPSQYARAPARAHARARPLRRRHGHRARRRAPTGPTRPRSAPSGSRGLGERWGTGANLDAARAERRRRRAHARVDGPPGAPVRDARRASLRVGAPTSRASTSAPLLPDLRVPTLILHRTGDRLIDVGHSRLAAAAHPRRAPGRAPRRRHACRWSATPRRCWARSRSSSPARAPRPPGCSGGC